MITFLTKLLPGDVFFLFRGRESALKQKKDAWLLVDNNRDLCGCRNYALHRELLQRKKHVLLYRSLCLCDGIHRYNFNINSLCMQCVFRLYFFQVQTTLKANQRMSTFFGEDKCTHRNLTAEHHAGIFFLNFFSAHKKSNVNNIVVIIFFQRKQSIL